MTGHDGHVSPPSPLFARTGPLSVSSSAPGGARRSMRRSQELVLAGSSSAATVGSPPRPTNTERRCSRCGKTFKSTNALNGHMRVHKKQDVEAAETLLKLRQGSAVAEGGASSSVAAGGQTKTICMEFDLTKKAAKK